MPIIQKLRLCYSKYSLTSVLARTQKTDWSKTGMFTISNNIFQNITLSDWHLLRLWYVPCLLMKLGLWDIIHIRNQSSVFFLPVDYLDGSQKSAGMLFFGFHLQDKSLPYIFIYDIRSYWFEYQFIYWEWYSRPNICRNRLRKSLDLSFRDYFS